jgi:predicted DNA-binding transcriptional regulator YafY
VKSSRLLSILLLLQRRGRVTAAELAQELEVSIRTVYRDVDALQEAGVPLYGDPGHGGGYRLVDGYRTRLTGLSAEEAEALFLAGVPGPAAELGLGAALALAQLKLLAALPPEASAQAERIRSRFHLDAPGWYADEDDAPFLREVADAVWHGRVLNLRYRRWKEPTDVDRRVEPYGLVLKAGRWYVVAGPGPRTYRIDQILALEVGEGTVEVPPDFDLAAYWRRYQEEFLARRYRAEAVVLVAAGSPACSNAWLARAIDENGTEEPDGRIRVVVPIESVDHAVGSLLALGADVEVLEPAELRERLRNTALALAATYQSPMSTTHLVGDGGEGR